MTKIQAALWSVRAASQSSDGSDSGRRAARYHHPTSRSTVRAPVTPSRVSSRPTTLRGRRRATITPRIADAGPTASPMPRLINVPGPGARTASTVAKASTALLGLGAVAVAVTVLWQPWGGRDRFGYADLAPHRDAAWLGTMIDGLGFAVVGITLGLAVCLLAPARGAAWANAGAVVAGLGGVAFCAGMVSFGSFAWYATEPRALPVDRGTALMTYVVDHPGHLLGLQMAGFLLVTLGSLVLMVALWRARSVPRWLPIGYAVLAVANFAADGVALNLVQAAQMLSLLAVAFFTARAIR